jgi:hypothetical protein
MGGNNSGFWNFIKAYWNHVPWAGTILLPIPQTAGTVSVMIPFAYISSTKTSCVGLGLGRVARTIES